MFGSPPASQYVEVAGHGVAPWRMVFRIPVSLVSLLPILGLVRHKGVAVAAGERRHTRCLGIQLMS